MNVWKKISALTFVLALALALSVSAFATTEPTPEELTGGKVSGEENKNAQQEFDGTFQSLKRLVNIKKDLVVYNANNHVTQESGKDVADGKVKAPKFSYTYTVTPVTTPQSVTDKYKVKVDTKKGITTDLKVNGGDAGTAENATGKLEFKTTDNLMANSTGAVNTYDITLDFSRVVFDKSGVYRYKIEETLTGNPTYDTLSMVDGEMNIVYLDVYVDGEGAIYGYVCLPGDESGDVAAAKDETPETTKINGFVKDAVVDNTSDDEEDTSKDGADYYYTYDLTLSKTVQNDNYAASHIAFPFTVFFKQDTSMTANFLMVETIQQASQTDTATVGFTGTNALAESTAGWSVVAEIKSGASITYSGIPCGMDVDVYETNTMDGVTYKVTTKTTKVNAAANATEANKYNTDQVDAAVISATEPNSAVEQSTRATSQSTKVTFNTTLAEAVAIAQECAITNALVNISPTGVTLRYAPYLLTLGAGITVLPLSRRYKKREEEI